MNAKTDQYNGKTTEELRQACLEQGLRTDGKRVDLVLRLLSVQQPAPNETS